MDALTPIIAGMTAILFGWIGYFLGNAFPVSGKAKKAKEKRSAKREQEGKGDPINEAVKKAIDWLLEREEKDTQPEASSNSLHFEEDGNLIDPLANMGREDAGSGVHSAATPPPPQAQAQLRVETPAIVGEDAVVLWHNRKQKKLYAKIEDDFFDLDSDLSPSQHGTLSMLLVDMQERVGIAATLRDAIAEGTDKVFAEKERKHQLPIEEKLEKPSFNPLKSLVNYVQSDVPKLEEHKLSIPEQIDEILQRNIAGTHLENKGISVREWPNRGVVFIVGIDIYEDLHNLPDPEIRSEIRKAVKEWEASQEEDV